MTAELSETRARRVEFVRRMKRVKRCFSVAGFVLVLGPALPGFLLAEFVLNGGPVLVHDGASRAAAVLGFGLPPVLGLIATGFVIYASFCEPRPSMREDLVLSAVLALPLWGATTMIAFVFTALYVYGFGGLLLPIYLG